MRETVGGGRILDYTAGAPGLISWQQVGIDVCDIEATLCALDTVSGSILDGAGLFA